MIRLGQHRAMPRPRLIGDQGRAWIREAANGVALIICMIGAFIVAQHAADAAAWLRGIHLGIAAGGQIIAFR